MSALPHAAGTPALEVKAPRWRPGAVVLGAALGLLCGFQAVFSAALPFFLLPWQKEFGWGRGEISAASVLSMLGVSLASPLVGRLFDRFGTERIIGVCVVLMSAAIFAVSRLPGNLVALGTLCFVVGVFGAGTSMVGYLGILPRWFDRRLGLALGLAGLGGGIGIGLAPFVATQLVAQAGWRGAVAGLAGIALVGGLLAFALIRPPNGEATRRRAEAAASTDLPGVSLREARREPRFWLLLIITFVVPLAILGIALHGAALFIDRGLSAQQAATGAALAGAGAVLARIGVGALLDRWHGPAVAAVVYLLAGLGLAMNSVATSFPILCLGSFLGGVAMGAEGDLLPYMLRRYFGLRAFGTIFGLMFSAYALGGVLGPVVYGLVFDRAGSYTPTMLAAALACALCAVAVKRLGAYRFGGAVTGPSDKPARTASDHDSPL